MFLSHPTHRSLTSPPRRSLRRVSEIIYPVLLFFPRKNGMSEPTFLDETLVEEAACLPDDGLVDAIQDWPYAPASQSGQPVVPSNRHNDARDSPALQTVAQLLECPGVCGKPAHHTSDGFITFENPNVHPAMK